MSDEPKTGMTDEALGRRDVQESTLIHALQDRLRLNHRRGRVNLAEDVLHTMEQSDRQALHDALDELRLDHMVSIETGKDSPEQELFITPGSFAFLTVQNWLSHRLDRYANFTAASGPRAVWNLRGPRLAIAGRKVAVVFHAAKAILHCTRLYTCWFPPKHLISEVQTALLVSSSSIGTVIRRGRSKRHPEVICGVPCGMIKTTLYLPEPLKKKLERAAAQSGQSEAAIIREGIQLAVDRKEPPKPRSGIFDSGDPHFSERVDEYLAGFGER